MCLTTFIEWKITNLRHNAQYNSTQHDDIQYNDAQHNAFSILMNKM